MNDVPRWQAKFISEFYYETYQSAGMPRRCNVTGILVNFVDRPDSLILGGYHSDLSVHDGHSELC